MDVNTMVKIGTSGLSIASRYAQQAQTTKATDKDTQVAQGAAASAQTAGAGSAYQVELSEAGQGKASETKGLTTDQIAMLQDGITKETLASLKGERMGILVEGVSARRESQMSGKCGRNISVNFTGGDEGMIGQIVPVKINGAGSNTLRGEYEKEQIT